MGLAHRKVEQTAAYKHVTDCVNVDALPFQVCSSRGHSSHDFVFAHCGHCVVAISNPPAIGSRVSTGIMPWPLLFCACVVRVTAFCLAQRLLAQPGAGSHDAPSGK